MELPRSRVLAELLLASPVCTYSAWLFYVRAVQSVKHRLPSVFDRPMQSA